MCACSPRKCRNHYVHQGNRPSPDMGTIVLQYVLGTARFRYRSVHPGSGPSHGNHYCALSVSCPKASGTRSSSRSSAFPHYMNQHVAVYAVCVCMWHFTVSGSRCPSRISAPMACEPLLCDVWHPKCPPLFNAPVPAEICAAQGFVFQSLCFARDVLSSPTYGAEATPVANRSIWSATIVTTPGEPPANYACQP
jgi:hypothetical protein